MEERRRLFPDVHERTSTLGYESIGKFFRANVSFQENLRIQVSLPAIVDSLYREERSTFALFPRMTVLCF